MFKILLVTVMSSAFFSRAFAGSDSSRWAKIDAVRVLCDVTDSGKFMIFIFSEARNQSWILRQQTQGLVFDGDKDKLFKQCSASTGQAGSGSVLINFESGEVTPENGFFQRVDPAFSQEK